MRKEKRVTLDDYRNFSIHAPNWICCLHPNILADRHYLAVTKISPTKQKVFQRPFRQANGYLINQTGKDSKCLQKLLHSTLTDISQASFMDFLFFFFFFNCVKVTPFFSGDTLNTSVF